MNEIHVSIAVRDRETKKILEVIGETSHPIIDPGEDVQAVHGWRQYVAERLALATKATVVAELTREAVMAQAPKLAGECPLCGKELGATDLLPHEGKPAHAACVEEEKAAAWDPMAVRDLLLLVAEEFPREDFPTDDEIRGWSADVLMEVGAWAGAVHLSASDHEDVTVPAVPEVLRDDASRAQGADDEGGAAPAAGAAGAPAGGRQAGTDPRGLAGSGVGPGEEVVLTIGEGVGDHGSSAGDGSEAHAGSGGAEAGGEGGGAVPRTRGRGRRGQAPTA